MNGKEWISAALVRAAMLVAWLLCAATSLLIVAGGARANVQTRDGLIAVNHFVSPNQFAVDTVDPSGSEQSITTDVGSNAIPLWSGDGKYIAFNHTGGGVWIMNSDGTNEHLLDSRLSSDYLSAWAASGSAMLVTTGTSTLLVSLDGLTVTRIQTVNIPSYSANPYTQDAILSPDGKQIAYLLAGSGPTSLWVADSDGSNPKEILDGTQQCIGLPAWSPDGARIAFRAMIPSKSDPCGTGGPGVDDGEIFTVAPDGSKLHQVTHFGPIAEGTCNANELFPGAWSPDSQQLVVDVEPNASEPGRGTTCPGLYVINADGSGMTQITHSTETDSMAAWQPQPLKISFYSYGVHGFIQFTDAEGVKHTFGKYATGNFQTDPAAVEKSLIALPGVLRDDSGTNWDWRITYHVPPEQYANAWAYTQNSSNVSWYNLWAANCVEFIQGAARAAGINLPNFTDLNAPVLGAFNYGAQIPDGQGMSAAMAAIGDGHTFNGGLVQKSDGTTAGGAPDPPPPPDAGAPGPLAQAALADPTGTATTYAYNYETDHLSSAAVPTDGPLTMSLEGLSGNSDVLTAIDWGDGSHPTYRYDPDPSAGQSIIVTHTYANAGTYSDHLVIVEDGVLASYTGTVVVGGSGSPEQSVALPSPGSYVTYDGVTPLTLSPVRTDTAVGVSSSDTGGSGPFTFTATVTPTDGQGMVSFFEEGSGIPISGCDELPLDSGRASCTTSSLDSGDQQIIATYSGDDLYAPASGVLPNELSVTSAPPSGGSPSPGSPPLGSGPSSATATGAGGPTATAMTLSSSSHSGVTGQRLLFTARITPLTDGGTVGFLHDGTAVPGCTAIPVSLAAGTATCPITFATPGRHSVVAVYSGDAQFAGQRAQLVENVRPSLRLIGRPSIRSNLIRFAVSCAPHSGGCRLTGLVLVTVRRQGNKVIAVSANTRLRRQTMRIGALTATIPAGHTRTLSLAIRTTGRTLLARFHQIQATFRLTMAVASRRTTVSTVKLTL